MADEEVTVGALEGCEVSGDGNVIRLALSEKNGEAFKLCLTPDQVCALAMTLPRLLTAALKSKYGDPGLRFVFPLRNYELLEVPGQRDLLLLLKTQDGFEVSFCVPPEMFQDMAFIADQRVPQHIH